MAIVNFYQSYIDIVTAKYSAAYCARSLDGKIFLIIVPARNAAEAETGSGILAIGHTELAAWSNALLDG